MSEYVDAETAYREYSDGSPLSAFGRVAGVSGSSVLLITSADRLRDPSGLHIGAILRIAGRPDGLAVVTGFNTPAPEAEPTLEDVMLVEAALCGRLEADGTASCRPTEIAPGAAAYLFDVQAEAEARQLAMQAPVVLGDRADATTLEIDAERLLGRRLAIRGDRATGRTSSLVVLVRALLRDAFPARLVLIDPEGAMGRSFGSAAETLRAGDGLFSFSMLTTDELIACLEVIGQPLSDQERSVLPGVVHTNAFGDTAPRLSQVIERCHRLAGESAVGVSAVYAGLAKRFTAAGADARLTAFFSETAASVGEDDVLQSVFRLPEGRPPMAVVQLDGLQPTIKGVAASALLRLSRIVAQAASGTIPILTFFDAADGLASAYPPFAAGINASLDPHFGITLVGNDVAMGQAALEIIHRLEAADTQECLLPPSEDARRLLFSSVSSLVPAEAFFVDHHRPWPELFRATELKAKTLPTRKDQPVPGRSFTREELVGTITEAWRRARDA